MSDTHVKAEDFRELMNALFDEYGAEVISAAETAARKTSDQARQNLRSTAVGDFKNRSGRYRKGWRASVEVSALSVSVTVYNKTDWQLTHLLEYGHQLIRGGRSIGEVRAYPHLEKENEWAAEEFQKRLKEEIEKA